MRSIVLRTRCRRRVQTRLSSLRRPNGAILATPVRFGGAPVDSGTYELFTIPDEVAWTVILQRARQQWGSYSYDASHDVVRITAPVVRLSEPIETISLGIGNVRPGSADLEISWERTRVPVRIEIDVRATAVPRVEAALAAEGRKPYFTAAMFYFENDIDLDRAAELMALGHRAAADAHRNAVPAGTHPRTHRR
jgi:hypothetical protein